MLEEEIEYFDRMLPEWLKGHQGRVALVKGPSLVGFFDSEDAAITEGARLYGNAPFLVRRVLVEAPEIKIPALTLGLLGANFPPSTFRIRR